MKISHFPQICKCPHFNLFQFDTNRRHLQICTVQDQLEIEIWAHYILIIYLLYTHYEYILIICMLIFSA